MVFRKLVSLSLSPSFSHISGLFPAVPFSPLAWLFSPSPLSPLYTSLSFLFFTSLRSLIPRTYFDFSVDSEKHEGRRAGAVQSHSESRVEALTIGVSLGDPLLSLSLSCPPSRSRSISRTMKNSFLFIAPRPPATRVYA